MSGIILTGNTTGNTLSRDVFMEVKESFNSTNIMLPLIETKYLASGHAAQFIIGGKDTSALAKTQGRSGATTATGSDITINPVKMDERIINLDNVVYDARQIDEAEEKVAQYDVRSPITRMIGSVLAQYIDKKIITTLGLACEATGVAGNPSAPAVLVNSVIASGTTAKDKGNALGETIMLAIAKLKKVDNYNEKVVLVDPVSAAYLAQSDFINKDYTSGDNGGLDNGKIGMVGGAKVYETNHLDAATNIEGLQAFVFSKEAVGYAILEDVKTEVNYDYRKFGTLISGRFKTGCGVLRPECAIAIASSVQS
jgi:hypothetical protein